MARFPRDYTVMEPAAVLLRGFRPHLAGQIFFLLAKTDPVTGQRSPNALTTLLKDRPIP